MAILLFAFGLVAGLATPAIMANLPQQDLPATDDIAALFALFDLMAQLPRWSLFLIILAKNISAVVISFILSPLICLVPVMALTLNGWIVGWISTVVTQEKSLVHVLAGLLPHGILELPALIMAGAAALSFGTAVMLAPFRKDGGRRLAANFRQNLKYLAIACGLLLPAAIIETYLTSWLLNQLG